MLGQLLAEIRGKVLEVIELGKTPAGNRMDIPVEWQVKTPAGKGTMRTVDYFLMRDTGVGVLDVHGILTMDDGSRIAVSSQGYAVPTGTEGVMHIKEVTVYLTSSKAYEYLNNTIAVVEGTYYAKTGEIELKAYEWK